MKEQQVIGEWGDLTTLLERWVVDGLISRDQADRIIVTEHLQLAKPTAVAHPRVQAARLSLAAEALGYLGGVLILVATALIVARYWQELPLAARLGLAASTAIVLLTAGSMLSPRLGPTGRRLRAVLWLLSTGAFAGVLALIAADLFDWQQGDDIGLFTASGTAVYAGALWAYERSGLQQVALFGALVATAAAAASHLESANGAAPGLAVWGLSMVWLSVAWGGLLEPRQAAYIIGSIGALFGAQATMTTGWGHILALATAAALVAAAVLVGDLVVLGIGAVGTLVILPGTVAYYFPGALAAPLALLAGGVLLVAAALRTARRQGRAGQSQRDRDLAAGTPTAALLIAAAIILAVIAAGLAIGLG